jgi:hypothetical protein
LGEQPLQERFGIPSLRRVEHDISQRSAKEIGLIQRSSTNGDTFEESVVHDDDHSCFVDKRRREGQAREKWIVVVTDP